MATLTLTLFGGFEASIGGQTITLAGKKARALLAYLALNPDQDHSREKIAALLWGNSGEEQARASLRQTLTSMRRALSPKITDGLVLDGEAFSLNASKASVDVLEFGKALLEDGPVALERAVGLYRGELLGAFSLREPGFQEWLESERTHLRRLVMDAFSRLLRHYEGTGKSDDAIGAATRLLELDPLQDEVHRSLMQLYVAQGRRGLALQQYELCRSLLREELEVEPATETEALYQAIREQREFETAAPAKAANVRRPWLIAVASIAAVVAVAVIAVAAWQLTRDEGEQVVMAAAAEDDAQKREALALPDKPSIAVLAFSNLSNDPDQEYFTDGMTEDIITDLSKISALFVIARNSSFAYKGKRTDVRTVARELGVRYVLEGSVRRAGDQVRINAQLVDASTGGHLWAERYDGTMEDVFALQDQVVQQIVSALAVTLTTAEQKIVSLRDTDSVEAYEAFLQGWQHYRRYTPEALSKAVVYLDRAIELDPEYGRAYAARSLSTDAMARSFDATGLRRLSASGSDPAVVRRLLGTGFGGRANTTTTMFKALKVPNSTAYQANSWLSVVGRRYENAVAAARRAVTLDPNDPEGFIALASALLSDGKPVEAEEAVETAMRLDPHYPSRYLYWLGLAKFHLEEFEEAAPLFEADVRRNPDGYSIAPLAATYGYLGRNKDARVAVEGWTKQVVENFGIPPSLELMHSELRFRRAEDSNRLLDGWREAGLPE